MSLLFADIFEAVRYLRLSKGTTEKDILDYIQDRVGGCLTIRNVLKTVSTLNKLVEEGVLVKKGKRYAFPTKPPQCQEEKEDKEEDCEGNNDEELMLDECDDPCDEDANEDENCNDDDTDDTDYTEEDEEYDDDDDDCDDKEMVPDEDPEKGEEPPINDNGVGQALTKNQPLLGTKKNGKDSGKVNENCDNGINNSHNVKNNMKKEASGRNASKSKSSVEDKNGNSREGEAIAFCNRDFIDSLYRPNAEDDNVRQREMAQDDALMDESFEEFNTLYSGKKRGSRSKRSRLTSCNYRSRSPIQGTRGGPYHKLKLNDSKDIGLGTFNSQLFEELVDTEMDVDMEKEADPTGVDYDIFRHQGPSSPLNRNAALSEKDSSCSNPDSKLLDEIKVEAALENEVQNAMKNKLDSTLSMVKGKDKKSGDKGKNKQKKESSEDDEKDDKDDTYSSLCSACDKKKGAS